MATLLARNADVLVTMDAERRKIGCGGFLARDGVIEAVGAAADFPATADEIIDLSGLIVLPGLINTHHHFYQNLTRADFAAYDAVSPPMSGVWDKVAGLVLGRHTVVEGRYVVRDGRLVTADLAKLIDEHGRMTRGFMNGG